MPAKNPICRVERRRRALSASAESGDFIFKFSNPQLMERRCCRHTSRRLVTRRRALFYGGGVVHVVCAPLVWILFIFSAHTLRAPFLWCCMRPSVCVLIRYASCSRRDLYKADAPAALYFGAQRQVLFLLHAARIQISTRHTNPSQCLVLVSLSLILK